MLRLAHKLITRNVKLSPGKDSAGLQSRCAELIADLESARAPITIVDKRTRNKAVAEAAAYNVSRTDLRRLLGVTRERVRQIIQRQKVIARLL